MNKKAINVGIVGFGGSVKNFHLPLIQACDGIQVTHLVVRTPSNYVGQLPEGMTICRCLEDMLLEEGIDLVVIATPTAVHFEQAKLALLAGKNVVVEKPFTVTSAEAKELIALAAQQNVMLSVFQNRRWDSDFQTVKKLIETGTLGRVTSVEIHFDRYRPVPKDYWKSKICPGSGILYDLGAHLIDQALVLFGEPSKVLAVVRNQRSENCAVDDFDILLSYNNRPGLRVALRGTMLSRTPGPKFIVHGTQGSYIKEGSDVQEGQLTQGQSPLDPKFGVEPRSTWGQLETTLENGLALSGSIESVKGTYISYYQNIVDVLCNQANLQVEPEEAAQVIEIIEQALSSTFP